MGVRGGRTRGPEIEIGGEVVAHPEGDDFAEPSDHNTDRGHLRNRGRKSSDKDGSPPQRGRKASRGERRFDAKKLAEKFRGKQGEGVNKFGHRKRHRHEQKDRGKITAKRLVGYARHSTM